MNSNALEGALQRLVKIDQGFLILDDGGIPAVSKLTNALGAPATTLLTTPKLAQFVAGIALPANWWRRSNSVAISFLELVQETKTLPGLDFGILELSPDDEFGERELKDYHAAGVRFVLRHVSLTTALPGVLALAHFAKSCQLAGLVPIIGARVELKDVPSALSAQETAAQKFLNMLANALFAAQVVLENCLLQWQFIQSDFSQNNPSLAKESIIANIRCLRRGVVSAIPEIVVEMSPSAATPN